VHSLPVFLRLTDRPVILIGTGAAADAKRRLLERAGAVVVDEGANAQLAIVIDDDAAVARLKARGVLVNAVDQPDLCDFTLPAIVDRDPVLVAIGTGGASAGLAAALRQRLEALLPAGLGDVANGLHAARAELRARWPDTEARRRVIGRIIDEALDTGRLTLADAAGGTDETIRLIIASPDPDDLTLRTARLLGQADRVYHDPHIAPAILDRARADAVRIAGPAPDVSGPGLTLILEHRDG
jgi:uroporphyrin-III C-methyltransferase/precorrin-2 dehydrogenase/sirohydrochlorin ferrochelatase